MRSKLPLLAGVLVLLLVNWSIVGKERQLREGRIVYLELAPVDPRSLMQGDYMALNYKLTNEIYAALPKDKDRHWRRDIVSADGKVVVGLDDRAVARFRRLENKQSLEKDEIVLRYRIRGGMLKFATNGYFFQEGQGKRYESARFGQFRVAPDGELLLASLHDKGLHKLGSDSDVKSGAAAGIQ